MKKTIRKFIRTFINLITIPIWHIIFPIMPIKYLSYIAGLSYGGDFRHQPLLRILLSLIGSNYKYAIYLLNFRLKRLPINKRREQSKCLWLAGTTIGWAQRAFDAVDDRSKDSAYMSIRNFYLQWKKSLTILELGCTNGGSLNCILYLGVKVSYYCGVDISEVLVYEARKIFLGNNNFLFFCKDFIEYCNETTEKFDILLIKQTFIFLDQDYLEKLLAIIDRKEIANRIVIKERQLHSHKGADSVYGDWGNAPVDYSHNYMAQFKKAGYVLESGGLFPHPDATGTDLLDGVFVRNHQPA